jgi:hypothetical protein
MKKTILSVTFLSVLLVSTAVAASDSVVIPGELRITGNGNGIVFPNGSRQTQAQVQGPPGTFSAAACTKVTSAWVYLRNFYTTITAKCPSATIPVSGGYNYGGWNAEKHCIPVNNGITSENDGWSVVWAAPNATECDSNQSATWVLCCP